MNGGAVLLLFTSYIIIRKVALSFFFLFERTLFLQFNSLWYVSLIFCFHFSLICHINFSATLSVCGHMGHFRLNILSIDCFLKLQLSWTMFSSACPTRMPFIYVDSITQAKACNTFINSTEKSVYEELQRWES